MPRSRTIRCSRSRRKRCEPNSPNSASSKPRFEPAVVRFDTFGAGLETRIQRPTTLIREAGGGAAGTDAHAARTPVRTSPSPGLPKANSRRRRGTGALLDREGAQRLGDAGLELPPESRAAEDELWTTVTTRGPISAHRSWRATAERRRQTCGRVVLLRSGCAAVTNIEAAPVPERAAPRGNWRSASPVDGPVNHAGPPACPRAIRLFGPPHRSSSVGARSRRLSATKA